MKQEATLVIAGGLLVLLSYLVFLPRALSKRSLDELWFGIDGSLRYAYWVSIALTTCFAVALFFDLSAGDFAPPPLFLVSLVVFFLGSATWAPSLAAGELSAWTSVSLALAAMGALGVCTTFSSDGWRWPTVAQLGCLLLVWQTLFMDFGIWNYFFLKATH